MRYMAKRHKIAYCECGAVYAGEEHYYKTQFCAQCGRWLYWDKHSSLAIRDTQYQSDINARDYNEEEWL